MKVTMLQQVTGTRDGEPWPARGETLDLPDAEARLLIAQGIAADPSAVDVDERPGLTTADLKTPVAPKAGSVAAIKDQVGNEPVLAAQALEVERAAAKPRTSLISYLEAIIAEAADDLAATTPPAGEPSEA